MTPSPPINNETDAHSILSNIHSIKAQAAIVHAILEAFGRRFNREESGRLTHESSNAPSDMTKLGVCTGKLGSPSGVAALLPALRDHLGIARVLRDKEAVGLPTKEQGEAGRGGRAIDDLQVEEIVLGLGPRMGLNPFRMEAVLRVHGHGHDHFFKKGLPVWAAVGRDMFALIHESDLDSTLSSIWLLAGQQGKEDKKKNSTAVPWHTVVMLAHALPVTAMHGLSQGTIASAMPLLPIGVQTKTKAMTHDAYMQACLL